MISHQEFVESLNDTVDMQQCLPRAGPLYVYLCLFTCVFMGLQRQLRLMCSTPHDNAHDNDMNLDQAHENGNQDRVSLLQRKPSTLGFPSTPLLSGG